MKCGCGYQATAEPRLRCQQRLRIWEGRAEGEPRSRTPRYHSRTPLPQLYPSYRSHTPGTTAVPACHSYTPLYRSRTPPSTAFPPPPQLYPPYHSLSPPPQLYPPCRTWGVCGQASSTAQPRLQKQTGAVEVVRMENRVMHFTWQSLMEEQGEEENLK